MTVIDDVIRQKPHLADPLRFYEKTLQFIAAARDIPLSIGPRQTAYGPELLDELFALFSARMELAESTLVPLKRAMELREIDFTRLPLGETPAFSLPYPEDDLAMLLSLLSRPWFLVLHDTCPAGQRTWEEGKCPVCNAQPVVTWIGEDTARHVSCSVCTTSGQTIKTGCPVCLATDASKQKTLFFEGEEGFRIDTCDRCRSYVKTIDVALVNRWSVPVADLASLPLDIIVQDKGYARRAPNPIGMRKITSHG
ncbi:MAG: hypothetical protein A2010_15985 [Nitrospirae bacterium GWD2_57_9]|nr:MAG: hypothetical protein A2010_15985 [Nitrospirae bacterium GWD2_57_9]